MDEYKELKAYLTYCLAHWALWIAMVVVLCILFDRALPLWLLAGGALTQQTAGDGK